MEKTPRDGGREPGALVRAHLRWIVLARKHPSAWLLAVQLLGVLLYPSMENMPAGRAVFGAFSMAVLGLSVWVVRRSPLTIWIALLLAIPAVIFSVAGALLDRYTLTMVSQVFECLLYFYTTWSLIAYMLQDHKVTRDELFAAGATFTLLAWAFAFAYSVCQHWIPGSFVAASDGDFRTWMELLYLSFSLLSGVGLSDVVPVLPQARALVMLEQFSGVMYVALVVSRLVGLTIYKAEKK